MTLPRRLQLLKLLGPRGLRAVERLRDDDVRLALFRLRSSRPQAGSDAPASHTLARRAEALPAVVDEDDPHALPRFREPRLFLPEGERTFLRAIAQKPRSCFFTWDVAHQGKRSGNAQLELRMQEFLGDPPDAAALFALAPAITVEVDLGASGWYVPVPAERLAVVGRLFDAEGEIARSNVTLTPPARPAPPGPLWVATLPPALDRRRLAGRAMMEGRVADAALVRVGESDARVTTEHAATDYDVPSSAAGVRVRLAATAGSPPSSSTLPSSGSKR